eukprot:14808231-Ditylum_brightwellii.AAC.1
MAAALLQQQLLFNMSLFGQQLLSNYCNGSCFTAMTAAILYISMWTAATFKLLQQRLLYCNGGCIFICLYMDSSFFRITATGAAF